MTVPLDRCEVAASEAACGCPQIVRVEVPYGDAVAVADGYGLAIGTK